MEWKAGCAFVLFGQMDEMDGANTLCEEGFASDETTCVDFAIHIFIMLATYPIQSVVAVFGNTLGLCVRGDCIK